MLKRCVDESYTYLAVKVIIYLLYAVKCWKLDANVCEYFAYYKTLVIIVTVL